MGDSLAANERKGHAWACAPLLLVLAYGYGPTLTRMVRLWSQDPQYTHGYVVPVFAAIVLWFRRDRFPGLADPTWWGVPLLLAAGFLRMIGTLFALEAVEAGSLVPALAGVILLTLGAPILRWSWPGATFLLFVLPWPWQLDVLLTYPLRQFATTCSTFALQTLGVPALARGNIIVINELEVGVVEACSGLGMLMTFFALSTGVAFVIQRPLGNRLLLFISAVPIGVFMNVVRITLTVFLYRVASAEVAQVVFHDVAGWVMMPMALVLLWLEILWLDRLWVAAEPAGARPTAVAAAPAAQEIPAWLRRQPEPAPDLKMTSRPDETRFEPRTAPSDPMARVPDCSTKQALADRPLQETPDVAC